MFYKLRKWIQSLGHEKFYCPRRSEGPAGLLPGPDYWRPGKTHWGKRKSDQWPDEFKKPRTCSFCGCVHINDAIKLINTGWEVEPSTKNYKWYLHPPGYNSFMKRLTAAIGDEKLYDKIMEGRKYKSPGPPVKIYGQHAIRSQLNELNRLYDLQLLARTQQRTGHLN